MEMVIVKYGEPLPILAQCNIERRKYDKEVDNGDGYSKKGYLNC